MPTKKKKKVTKKKARSSRRKGGSRGGLMVLLGLLVVVGLIVATVMMMKEPPIKPIPADVRFTFGAQGSGKGEMSSPRGLAVDAAGNYFVVDLGNSRVDKFDKTGKFLLSFGKKSDPASHQPNEGEFNEPSGIAVNSAGNVLVADAWNGRIQEFNPEGKFLQQFGGTSFAFYSPRNVATDRLGNFYVADTGNSRIQIFSPDGTRLKIVGELGKGGGRFKEIFGLAVNSQGEIFAADPGNGMIHKFSALPDPKFLKDKKVPGWQRNSPFWPHLAIDSADRVYAVDSGNRQIWVYDADLKYVGTIGAQPGKDFFAAPLGLAFNPDNQLAVVDMNKGDVVVFNTFNFPTGK